MEIDIAELIIYLLGLIAAIIAALLIPFVRSKITAQEWEVIRKYAEAIVKAAEIIFNSAGMGAQKLNYALENLQAVNKKSWIKLGPEMLRIAVENAWDKLGLNKGA